MRSLGTLWSTDDACDGVTVHFASALGRFGFMERRSGATGPDVESWDFASTLFHTATRRGPAADVATEVRGFAPPPPSNDRASVDEINEVAQTVISRATAPPTATPPNTLSALMKRRRSYRNWSSRALPVSLLMQFLGRVAGRREFSSGSDTFSLPELPSAGGLPSLGWYVAANRVDGLDQGVFSYCPETATFRTFPGSDAAARTLAANAARSMARAETQPHAVIVLTVKLSVLAPRYGPIAYRLALLNAGVAIGAMYYVATDMNLGACALGTGDPTQFEESTGLHWPGESPIAELALGWPASAVASHC
jgi:SagB-type dehydrogenase family enzyme